MPVSTVRARRGSIKFADVFLKPYDEDTMPSLAEPEAQGFCVTLGGVVLTVAAYEALCSVLGGVPV